MKHTGNQVFWRAARRVGIFLIGIELAAALIIPGLSWGAFSGTATPSSGMTVSDATMPAPSGVDGTSEMQAVYSAPQTSNALLAISCVTTFCMAGWGGAVEMWTPAGGWGAVISDPSNMAIDSISCVSATFCMGAGLIFDQSTISDAPAISEWNGNKWLTPYIFGSYEAEGTPNNFSGVSCVSTTFCLAVGTITLIGGSETADIVYIWNGSTWSSNTPSPSLESLTSVSCASSTFCLMTGSTTYNGSSNYNYRWTGSTTGSGSYSDFTGTTGISCILGSSACWEIGYNSNTGSHGIVELNGTSWGSVTSGGPDMSISCVSIANCWAVGYNGSNGWYVAGWNGSTWGNNIVLPNQSYVEDTAVISCMSTTLCLASSYRAGNNPAGWVLNAVLSLTWAAPANTSDADGNPLVASQQVVEAPYNGSTCGTSWSPVTSGLSASATSATVSSPSSSECYSVEAVGRNNIWTSGVPTGVQG